MKYQIPRLVFCAVEGGECENGSWVRVCRNGGMYDGGCSVGAYD